MIQMVPIYNTKTFAQVWDSSDKFRTDITTGPFGETDEIKGLDLSIIYFLLFSRYGNNPIANMDINQFKIKVGSTLYQYGPVWAKKMEIQRKLRSLSDSDLLTGSKSIYNHAMNPSTEPSTSSLDELNYINDQNTNTFKKAKMDAYAQLWDILRTDVTNAFLEQFKYLFTAFVYPSRPTIYFDDDDNDGYEEDLND